MNRAQQWIYELIRPVKTEPLDKLKAIWNNVNKVIGSCVKPELKEWRQISSFGGMEKVEICHHNPDGLSVIAGGVEGCSGCDGPAYVLADDAYVVIEASRMANWDAGYEDGQHAAGAEFQAEIERLTKERDCIRDYIERINSPADPDQTYSGPGYTLYCITKIATAPPTISKIEALDRIQSIATICTMILKKRGCQFDTDGDGNCPFHPFGCPEKTE